jgi:hypothetical protein
MVRFQKNRFRWPLGLMILLPEFPVAKRHLKNKCDFLKCVSCHSQRCKLWAKKIFRFDLFSSSDYLKRKWRLRKRSGWDIYFHFIFVALIETIFLFSNLPFIFFTCESCPEKWIDLF